MIRTFKNHWPLAAVLAMLLVALAIVLPLSLNRNQGHLIYAFDDAYIHMAMATNFSQHGIWGLTRDGFTSSSSSLLWTALLALTYKLFGVNDLSPFVLNSVFAVFFVVWAYFVLKKRFSRPKVVFAALAALVFFAPVPALMFVGLEHLLHALLNLAFVYHAARILSRQSVQKGSDKMVGARYIVPLRRSGIVRALSEHDVRWRDQVILLVLAPLVLLTRFEGLFLLFVVGGLLLLRKRFGFALLMGGLGMLPVTVYGLVSLGNGWLFLPNSVLLKGNAPAELSVEGLVRFVGKGYFQAFAGTPGVMLLVFATVVLLGIRERLNDELWDESSITGFVFVALTALHMQFASAGWFFRYEAYLAVLGIYAVALLLYEVVPRTMRLNGTRIISQYARLPLLLLLVTLPVLVRSSISLFNIPRATSNIYQQQFQMALFLDEFYQGKGVALNDIGLTFYRADIDGFDLEGLARMDVADVKRAGPYGSQQITMLTDAADAAIAVVYSHWFDIPPHWKQVGQWTITNNIVAAGDTVTFYALDPAEESALAANLRSFSSKLPSDVVQSGKYLQ